MIRGIVMATYMEAAPFIEGLGLSQIEDTPFRTYAGNSTVLILSGIGKSCAAMATARILDRHGISVVFNMGAAGALREGFAVGDILQINSIIEYDRPELISGKLRQYSPAVLEGHAGAVLATQDIPVLEPAKRAELGRVADLVDMEAAAVAQACALYSLELHCFKIVTDTPEHVNDRDIIRNVKATRQNLYAYYREKIGM